MLYKNKKGNRTLADIILSARRPDIFIVGGWSNLRLTRDTHTLMNWLIASRDMRSPRTPIVVEFFYIVECMDVIFDGLDILHCSRRGLNS